MRTIASSRRGLLIAAVAVIALAAAPAGAQSVTDRDGKKVFLRGVGWSPWHAVHGWGRTKEVVEQDWELLRGMHANALRPWGPTKGESADAALEQGFYILPQLGRGPMPKTKYADGKECGMPVFTAPEALADIRAQGQKLGEACAGHRGVIGYNLGNEYAFTGVNATQNYVYNGFDERTLADFRKWLERRLGSVARLNEAAGTAYESFDAVKPPSGVAKNALFYEWWLFLRAAFADYLRAGAEGLRSADPRTPITYARLCGNRWDPATEDADCSFLDIEGDNLYYHWDKDWGKFCARLDRVIGPGRPVLLTESGFNTYNEDPAKCARLMKQMLWVSVLHPEVAGIFPFVYCDEWWVGGDPKKQDSPGDYWGLITADRKPKATYHAVAETYRAFEALGGLLTERQSPPEVLISDQCVDWWRGVEGVAHADVGRELYRRGISFRLVSLLRPETLRDAPCRRLVLVDSTLPDDADGKSPALQAVLDFADAGGEVLTLCAKPWQGIYRKGGVPAALADASGKVKRGKGSITLVRDVPNDAAFRQALASFLPGRDAARPEVVVPAGGEVFWRSLRAGGQRYLLLVNTGPEPLAGVALRRMGAKPEVISADGARLEKTGREWRLTGLNTYAVVR